jgi:hypothetical protein
LLLSFTLAEMLFAQRPDPQSTDAKLSDALRLQVGQTDTLLSMETVDYPLFISMMGVTQHPGSLYTYNADGKSRTLAAPLGTMINPLYTCRDLGGYIEVDRTFTISVKNGVASDGTSAARAYAGIIGYKTQKGVKA